MPRSVAVALRDIHAGWKRRDLWAILGLHDVRRRYRRSTLGPFWITISMGVTIFAIGFVFGQLFGNEMKDYLPFLAAGFVVWALVSSLIIDGCNTFISAEGMIRQLNVPISIYAFRQVWAVFIAFAHNIWIFFVVAVIFGVGISWSLLWILPAVLLMMVNGVWIAILFGMVSLRFRDFPLIVGSLVQLLFFMTPVLWRPEMLPDRPWLIDFNPFYHMVEILRAPLLGQSPSLENWLFVILVAMIGWAMSLFIYARYRWRVAYWI